MEQTKRCYGPCGQMKPWGEMNGYQWCRECADAQEAANRAKSGITSDFGPIAEKAVSDAIAQFPETFALRGRPGTYRIGRRESYVSRGVIYLYTQRLWTTEEYKSHYGREPRTGEDLWVDSAKGTVEELRREIKR